MQAINQQSRRERLAAYRRNPFSLFLAALVTLSAVITLAVLISLIIYILYRLFFNKLYLFLLFALFLLFDNAPPLLPALSLILAFLLPLPFVPFDA